MEIGQGFSFGLGVIFTFYFFLYIKSSCVLLFVVFLMEKGNKKLLKKKKVLLSQSRTLTLQRNLFYLLQWTPFNNVEKIFLFHLKSYIRSKDIEILLNFWSCRKNGLIRKIRLISKYFQNFTIHTLPNISRSKDN